jgi:hypothetical protein
MKMLFESVPAIEAEDKEYEFFDDVKERKELFDYSKKIAEYLRSEKVPNLVILDRSSRPLYIGVKEYLQPKYPEEKMANIYFMNPKGFVAKEEKSSEEIAEIINDCEWKDDLKELPQQVRSKEEILNEFQESYHKLLESKDLPVLLFDTCIHSGNSLEPVKKVFDQANFSDVRVGSINPSDEGAKVKTDFYVTKERPEKGCYPFDRDRIIEKTFNHVYSKKADHQKKRDRSIRLRKEIKEIVGDFLKKEIRN